MLIQDINYIETVAENSVEGAGEVHYSSYMHGNLNYEAVGAGTKESKTYLKVKPYYGIKYYHGYDEAGIGIKKFNFGYYGAVNKTDFYLKADA